MATATKGKKRTEIDLLHDQQTIKKVDALKVNEVVQKIGETQTGLVKALSEVSASLTNQFSELEQVNEAISLKRGELANLHKIAAAADTLDQLNADIEKTRTEWTAEQQQHTQSILQAQQELAKAREREQADYSYQTEQRNKKAIDAYNALVSDHQRTENIRQAEWLRDATQREAVLKSRETEFKTAIDTIAAMPETIKKEADKREASIKVILTKDFEQTRALDRLEAQNKVALQTQTITSQQQTIQQLDARLTEANAQIGRLQSDTKEIATQAVQASSQRETSKVLQDTLQNAGGAQTPPRR